MKLSQAVLFITLLTTSDAMSIRGVGHEDKTKAEAVLEQQGDHRQLSHVAGEPIALRSCEDFAVMAGSTATCAGSFDCGITGGHLAVSPGTSITGKFVGDVVSPTASADCATDGLAAWKMGRAMTGTPMLAEMGGKTFGPGTHTHGSAINIALTNPVVQLDAGGDPTAQFIFNIGSTLTTSAGSKVELLNGANADNVFWVLGTALTMGADCLLVGNVLAGTAITMGTNAKIMGRAIAQTAVTCETACAVETSGRHSAFPSLVPSAHPSHQPSVDPNNQPTFFDFEDGNQGWTSGVDARSTCGAQVTASTHWERASKLPGAPGVELGSIWWTNPNNGNDGAERSHVTSPSITAACTNPSITFDSYSSNEGGYPVHWDVEHVQLSINGGLFMDVHGHTADLHTTCDQVMKSITFTTNSGINVGDSLKYRFLFDTCDGCCGCQTVVGWAFDNVNIHCPVPGELFN